MSSQSSQAAPFSNDLTGLVVLTTVIQVYFLRSVSFELWTHTGCSEVSFHRKRGVFAFLKIPTPLKPRLSSCTSNCFHAFTAIFSSQDFIILFRPSVVRVSAFCSAYRHSWILLVQRHRLARCDGGTWKRGKSFCVHTTPIHCVAIALRGFVVTEDMHLSQVVCPSASETPEGPGIRLFFVPFFIF